MESGSGRTKTLCDVLPNWIEIRVYMLVMKNNTPDSMALVSSPEPGVAQSAFLAPSTLFSPIASPAPVVSPDPLASLAQIALLADRELLERIGRLVERERRATASLVAHLAEMDRRRLHLGLGYASLFTYCTQALHLSEHAAYKRIEAARAARRFPDLLARLAEGALHLSAVVLLAPVLTPENQSALIAEARHKTKRQVEEIVARIRPAGPVPTLVRKQSAPPAVPASALPSMLTPAPQGVPGPSPQAMSAGAAPGPDGTASILAPAWPPTSPARSVVVPLAPDRFKVQFTAGAEMHARLTRAQALLRHQVPDGDIAQVLDLALIVLLEKTEGRKFGRLKTGRRSGSPRRSGECRASTRTRYIPAAVRRAVWERDQGRCTFTSPEGVRCTETGFLEFDHRGPFACGGAATVGNLRLACRRHNQHLARLRFGPDCGRVREERPSYLGFRPSTLRWRRARKGRTTIPGDSAQGR